MYTLRFVVDIGTDRKIALTLPPDVPLGKVELEVTITPFSETKATDLETAFKKLHDAGGNVWDGIDAIDYVQKIRGE